MEKDSLESAFFILEMYGVPKSRAQTVSNGIMVLVTRMEKEISSLEYQIKQLQNTSSNSDYAKCTRIEQPENKSDSSKYMKCPKCGKFTSQQSKNFNGSWCINEDCLHEFYFA